MYDDYDNHDDWFDDEESYDGYEDFDCGWTHKLGQLCDDAGTESCSFFCPHYQAMIGALNTHPNIPPTWAGRVFDDEGLPDRHQEDEVGE